VNDIPDRIYLQVLDEDGEPSEGATWCKDRVYDTDVLYVRIADTIKRTVAGVFGYEENV